MAVAKDSQLLNLEIVPTLLSFPSQNVIEIGLDLSPTLYYGGDNGGELGGGECVEDDGSRRATISGRRRGGIDSKPWQQEGDWSCPHPSCSNVNFSSRGICNRCGIARPAGSFPAVGGGLCKSRIRGQGLSDSGCRSGRRASCAPGVFGPNDWNCPMCGNINWAKRTKCNICNTAKPGHNEGGARDGRAGGYKEFDEGEIEESKRRRREMEEDDGEMYDEFGNLKKKYRAKARAGDSLVSATLVTGAIAKSGWDMDELGVAEQSKEKSKDQSCLRCNNDIDDDRRGRDYVKNVPNSRSSQRGNERDRGTRHDVGEWNRGQDQDYLYVEDPDRGSGGAWAWEKFVLGRCDKNDYTVESENDPHCEWRHHRKRLRERDRIMN